MNLSRLGIFFGSVVFLLFCLGFGWGPVKAAPDPEPLALIGLTAVGLLWPAIVLGAAARVRRAEQARRTIE